MIWLKTLGVACVISAFGGYGLLGARRIDNRVEQIKTARMAMGFLEKEITYLQTPLSQALEHTARLTPPPMQILFAESSRSLQNRQGISVGEAWEIALARLQDCSDLHADDLEILRTVASQLGASGVEEQKKLFHLIQEELKIQEEKARGKVASERKLWSYGGFILGATVVLILL